MLLLLEETRIIIGKVYGSVTGGGLPSDSCALGMELARAGYIPTLYQPASDFFICEQ